VSKLPARVWIHPVPQPPHQCLSPPLHVASMMLPAENCTGDSSAASISPPSDLDLKPSCGLKSASQQKNCADSPATC